MKKKILEDRQVRLIQWFELFVHLLSTEETIEGRKDGNGLLVSYKDVPLIIHTPFDTFELVVIKKSWESRVVGEEEEKNSWRPFPRKVNERGVRKKKYFSSLLREEKGGANIKFQSEFPLKSSMTQGYQHQTYLMRKVRRENFFYSRKKGEDFGHFRYFVGLTLTLSLFLSIFLPMFLCYLSLSLSLRFSHQTRDDSLDSFRVLLSNQWPCNQIDPLGSFHWKNVLKREKWKGTEKRESEKRGKEYITPFVCLSPSSFDSRGK